MKTAALILKKIEALPEGELFASAQFLGLGLRANIDQILSRLIKKGVIVRVSRGLFVRAKMNPHVGPVIPGPYKVVEAYARTHGLAIQVHGAEALRQFGLSTQVSVRPIFYTSGPSRRFRIGELTVVLKHVSPKKMVHAGSKVGLAITALWYLGKNQVTPTVIEAINKKLLTDEVEILKAELHSMPSWMADIFYHHAENKKHVR